jgi:hypothetical protein
VKKSSEGVPNLTECNKTSNEEEPLRLQKHTFLNPPLLKGQELLKNVFKNF